MLKKYIKITALLFTVHNDNKIDKRTREGQNTEFFPFFNFIKSAIDEMRATCSDSINRKNFMCKVC